MSEVVQKIIGEVKFPRSGDSAYQIAVNHGFVGTEEEWLASLKGGTGKQGEQGEKGEKGDSPVRGKDYWNETDIATMEAHCNEYIDTHITQAIGGAY